jgi:hypothetical protein
MELLIYYFIITITTIIIKQTAALSFCVDSLGARIRQKGEEGTSKGGGRDRTFEWNGRPPWKRERGGGRERETRDGVKERVFIKRARKGLGGRQGTEYREVGQEKAERQAARWCHESNWGKHASIFTL